jgi:hypothetical protein
VLWILFQHGAVLHRTGPDSEDTETLAYSDCPLFCCEEQNFSAGDEQKSGVHSQLRVTPQTLNAMPLDGHIHLPSALRWCSCNCPFWKSNHSHLTSQSHPTHGLPLIPLKSHTGKMKIAVRWNLATGRQGWYSQTPYNRAVTLSKPRLACLN